MGTKNPKTSVVMSVLLLGVVCIARGRIITVDDDAPADFNNIQAAIDDANDWDIVEVRPGVYRGFGNRDIDFKGKAITVCSTDPNDPNVVATTVIDCNGTWEDAHRGFYFHSGEDANSVLDGLSIINGCVFGLPLGYNGGGILGENNSSPTVRNCVITGNYAAEIGGGLHGCNGTISNCLISNNGANLLGGGLSNCHGYLINCVVTRNRASNDAGGGLFQCNANIINCAITDNWAVWGGGLYACAGSIKNSRIVGNWTFGAPGGGLLDCSASITSCSISNNYGPSSGGGLAGCDGPITDCTITGNSASLYGGGLCTCRGPLTNCTITGNFACLGGGLESCDAPISNCIIWNNRAYEEGDQLYSSSDPNYSCIQDWDGGGIGNMVDDPCFADPGHWDDNNTPDYPLDDLWVEGDYRLKSQAGRWNPNTQSWVQDDVTSPCIDAGDPNSPIGLEPFPNGGRINMGAYGGTAEASRSYCGDRFSDEAVAADINGDCKVDFKDVAILAFHWLKDNNP